MKKIFIASLLLCFSVSPFSADAAGLTDNQIASVISLIQSFGADATTIANVQASLTGSLLVSSANNASCHSFSTNLSLGSTGDDVVALNAALSQAGIDTSGNSASFAANTRADVIAFQARYGIRQTGYVGTVTRAKLNSMYGCVSQPSTVPSTQSNTPTPVAPVVAPVPVAPAVPMPMDATSTVLSIVAPVITPVEVMTKVVAPNPLAPTMSIPVPLPIPVPIPTQVPVTIVPTTTPPTVITPTTTPVTLPTPATLTYTVPVVTVDKQEVKSGEKVTVTWKIGADNNACQGFFSPSTLGENPPRIVIPDGKVATTGSQVIDTSAFSGSYTISIYCSNNKETRVLKATSSDYATFFVTPTQLPGRPGLQLIGGKNTHFSPNDTISFRYALNGQSDCMFISPGADKAIPLSSSVQTPIVINASDLVKQRPNIATFAGRVSCHMSDLSTVSYDDFELKLSSSWVGFTIDK